MKTLRTHRGFRLVRLASMVILCVAIGLLGTQQRAEAWSAGPLLGLDLGLPPGGAHGMMAQDAVTRLVNNLLPAGYLSARDQQLLREGASTPDSIWGVGAGMKNTWWWEGALELESLIGRDVVEWHIFDYSCIDEPCFTLKDDWENDFDNLMNHEFADLNVWNPIKYWADKAKQDLLNNSRERAMVHAGYAMHFAEDYLNPPHFGPLLWGSYQEVDWPLDLEVMWENNDFYYVPKAWSAGDFQIISRCFTSVDAFATIFKNDLLSYRHSSALLWPTLPTLSWIYDQGQPGVVLDQRIANAVMWSEQAAYEVLQYIFDLKPPGGCRPISCDFDNDAKTDIAFYRTGTGVWWITPSSGAPAYGYGWGGPGFKPVPGDYDGDRRTDIAIYNTSGGAWWIIPTSGIGPQGQVGAYGVGWGGSAFKPVHGDYDGDGKTDIAIYNTAGGAWWIIPSSGIGPQGQLGAYGVGWGGSAFKPVHGDYDGDGKTDIAIYDTSGGAWWIIPSSGTGPQGQTGAYGVGWGGSAFKPVPGDYDGDGKTDIAIYRATTGGWWIIPSSGTGPQGQAGAYGVGWGGSEFTPVPGDYDGDGKTDVAIYQSGNGGWWIIRSSDGSTYSMGWGGDASDVPLTTNPD